MYWCPVHLPISYEIIINSDRIAISERRKIFKVIFEYFYKTIKDTLHFHSTFNL